MKAVFVLCLLAFITCEKDIMDIGKCIYKAPKVKELIADALVAIATKDFSKLWPKIKESLPELIQIVVGCIMEEKKAVQEEPVLQGFNEGYCEGSCKYHYPDTNSWAYKQCYQYCIKNMPN